MLNTNKHLLREVILAIKMKRKKKHRSSWLFYMSILSTESGMASDEEHTNVDFIKQILRILFTCVKSE